MRQLVIGIALVALTSTEAAAAARTVDEWVAERRSTDWSRRKAAEQELEKIPRSALPALAIEKSWLPEPAHRGGDPFVESMAKGHGDAVVGLLPLLDRDDGKLRETTIQIIGWIGPAAEPAMPSLVRALRDPVWGVRMQAAFALRSVGVSTPEAISALRALLGDETWIVANAASLALASAPANTTRALADALGDANQRIRRFATHALTVMSRPPESLLPRLFDMLQSDEPDIQLEVIAALRTLPASELRGAVPTLLQLLESPRVRCDAARLLAVKGEQHAAAALPALIEAMTSALDADQCADHAYGDVAAIGPAAVPALIGLLAGPASRTRRSALLALGTIAPQTPESLKSIAGLLADESLGGNAQQLLAEIGSDAVGVLIEALLSETPAARRRAAYALIRLGPAATAAVPTLVARLPLESGDTKRAVMAAIGRFAGERSREAIPELRRALTEPSLRRDAAGALARIAGPEAADVAPILIDALRIEVKEACRHGTADVELKAIGRPALPLLLGLLGDESFPSKLDVFWLLDAIGPEALAAARPVFVRWVDDDRSPWALDAAERLQRLDGPSDRIVGIFVKALGDGNPWTRLRGAEGLVRGAIGADLARPVLLQLRTHEYEMIRSRAEAALQQMLSSSAAL